MENRDGVLFEYARDIVDGRLLCVRLLQRLWIVILSTVVGAVLFGGVYFTTMRLAPKEKEYEAKLAVYLEYYRGEEEPLGWVCFTQDAWKEFVVSDDFVEDVVNRLDGRVSAETYKDSISSVLLPDGRVLTIIISTSDPDKSVQIAEALIGAVDDFAATQERILWTKPLTVPKEATLKLVDDRTVNMTILGAVIGFLVSFLVLLYILISDDSTYVPELFECRYELPVLDMGQPEEFKAYYRFLTGEKDLALYPAEKESSDMNEVKKQIAEYTGHQARIADITDPDMPKEKEAVLLLVKAGVRNGKQIEKMVHLLIKKGTPPEAAVLYGTDEKLLKLYYGHKDRAGKG